MTTETAPAVQLHQETLIVPCPRCGGTLVRSICNPSLFAFSTASPVVRSETIECRDCGHRYDMPEDRSHTQERIHRGDAPLRDVVGIERGIDGEGMQLHLECKHTLRLQRRAYRFSQKRARCVECRDLAEEMA